MSAGYSLFILITGMITFTYRSTGVIKSNTFGTTFWTLLKDFQFTLLCIVCFLFGILIGIYGTFMNWFLLSLDASHTLIGISTIIAGLSELPIMFTSAKIMKTIGPVNCLYITYLTYAIRFIAYSFLRDPWLSLTIEPLHGVTWSLMFSVAQSYAASLSPPGLQATGPGLTNAARLVGQAIGIFSGGVLYDTYGPRTLFRGCAVLAGFGILLLALGRLIYRLVHSPQQSPHHCEDEEDEHEETKPLLNGDSPNDTYSIQS